MSKAMYANFERLCFYRADFESVSRVILVQDYSAMKLAGRPAMEIARDGSEPAIWDDWLGTRLHKPFYMHFEGRLF
jgi:hypothetical protein